MIPAWQRDLFKLGDVRFRAVVALRVATVAGLPVAAGAALGRFDAGVVASFCAMLATLCDFGDARRERLASMAVGGAAMVAGGAAGALDSGHGYLSEAVVLVAAAVVGLAAGTRPAISTIARFFAIAVLVGDLASMPIAALYAAVGGIAVALVVPALIWWCWPELRAHNACDWHQAISRAFAFDRPDPRFAAALVIGTAIALFAADELRLARPYWAAATFLMVMRREGTESLRLTLHYALGTVAGLVLAAVLAHALHNVYALAATGVAFAAVTRVALAGNPALGFTTFTVFLLLMLDAALPQQGPTLALWTARLYDVAVGCALAVVATLAARR